MYSFQFYIVYKGEYNYDKDIGLSKENVERLKGLLEECSLPDGFDEDYKFLYEVINACENILNEVEDDC